MNEPTETKNGNCPMCDSNEGIFITNVLVEVKWRENENDWNYRRVIKCSNCGQYYVPFVSDAEAETIKVESDGEEDE